MVNSSGLTYSLPIPAQTISFSLTAVSSNNNPTIPTVTPQPFNGNTSTAYPFTFTATDPDAGDQIAYEVDWNNDGIADQSTSFVSSGTSQSLSNPMAQWSIAGTYSFKVRTKDNKGGVSAWAAPSVTLAPVVIGACGPATLVPSGPAPSVGLCTTGTATIPALSASNWAWGCNGSGGGSSTALGECVTSIATNTLTAAKNLVSGGQGTIIDTTRTGTSIDSTAIPSRNSEIIPYGGSRTLRAHPNSSNVSWSVGCTSVSIVGIDYDCTVNNITATQTVVATFTGLPEDGACGTANGNSYATANEAITAGLCAFHGGVPLPSTPSLSGTTYSWICKGSSGSLIDSPPCTATQLRNYNWTEGSP